MPPDAEKRGVFGRAACGALQSNHLSNDSRAIPLRETHPDAIAVFIQPRRLYKGAISLAFDAPLGIALPDTHHRVQAFLLFVRAQFCVRSAIRRKLFTLHVVLPALRASKPPAMPQGHQPAAQQKYVVHYPGTAAVPGYKRAETACVVSPPVFLRWQAERKSHLLR